jgi:hypothetical protein
MTDSIIVAAAGATAVGGTRGLRGKLIQQAIDNAVAAYVKEVGDHNAALQPADYVDEHGETVTGFVDPKRFRQVLDAEILEVKIAARKRAKDALSTLAVS